MTPRPAHAPDGAKAVAGRSAPLVNDTVPFCIGCRTIACEKSTFSCPHAPCGDTHYPARTAPMPDMPVLPTRCMKANASHGQRLHTLRTGNLMAHRKQSPQRPLSMRPLCPLPRSWLRYQPRNAHAAGEQSPAACTRSVTIPAPALYPCQIRQRLHPAGSGPGLTGTCPY